MGRVPVSEHACKPQARLEANANAALAEQGFDWAGVRMHGQRAELTGKAPSMDAIEAAAETVLTSSGSGGIVLGGVTMVESGVGTAPPVTPMSGAPSRLVQATIS